MLFLDRTATDFAASVNCQSLRTSIQLYNPWYLEAYYNRCVFADPQYPLDGETSDQPAVHWSGRHPP